MSATFCSGTNQDGSRCGNRVATFPSGVYVTSPFCPRHRVGAGARRQAVEDRFWEKVDKRGPDECWPWLGAVVSEGRYGRFWKDGPVPAHRAAYELLVGPIPGGLTIDHLCRNTLCVNPAHLEPVSIRENILRGTCPPAVNAARTHCQRGHEFRAENTYINHQGRRACRKCSKASRQRYVARQALAQKEKP